MREVAQAIVQDVRFGARLLMRDRGFAVMAILVLGFGIGVNNMLFTILRAHTMRGLPIDRPDRVLYFSTFDQQVPDRGVSYPELQDVRAHARSFSSIAAYSQSAVALADDQRAADRVDAAYVTANAFRALGIRPMLGRTFDESEDHASATPVVVLGSGVWQSRYANDEGILGRSIRVNGAPFTVVGVMPPHSGFPSTADLWLPLGKLANLTNQPRNARTLRVFGRMNDGVREADARSEIEALVARLSQEFPDTSRGNRARVVPINQRVLGRLTDPAWMAFMAFGFLALLVSCANVANLMLAHAVDRAREIAVRTSLGATRLRVVRQLVIESALIAAFGGALGVAVSFVGVRLFAAGIPDNTLPYWLEYRMDAVVLGALAAIAIATVFLFGVVPAFHASKADVNRVLRGGGRGIVHASRSRRWTSAFTALELGVTVIMLSYLVADLQSSDYDLPSDPIVDTREVLTGNVSLPAATYGTPETRKDFYARLRSELSQLPGAFSVSMASLVPRRGAVPQKVEIEGKPLGAGIEAPSIGTVAITPGFFDTLALAIERGRDFTPRDAESGTANILVSTRFVELFLPDRDPIGSRIRFVPATPAAPPSNGPAVSERSASNGWLTIVGVAPQINHRSPNEAVAYLPFDTAPPSTASVLLRTRDEPALMTGRLRETLRRLDPNLPIYRILTMTQVIEEQTWNGRISSNIVRSIATIAFLFCIVGLYAVMAHAVAQRTNEIGVRMALGARPRHVGLMILKRAAVLVALGLAVGVAGTLVWGAVFGTGALEDRFLQPAIVGPIVLLLVAAMLLACWLPARRAIRLDPMSALRSE